MINPVWELYRLAHQLTGGVSTLLEWDAKIPPFPVLHAEVLKARQHMDDDLPPTDRSPKHPPRCLVQHNAAAPRNVSNRPNRMTEPHKAKLDAVQRWMQSVITHPQGVEAGLASDAARSHLDVAPAELAAVIDRSSAQTSVERLGIYATAYYARLIECLEAEFPIFRQTVGADAFADFAFGYLTAFPSHSYTLAQLGAHFPSFLEKSKPPSNANHTADWPDFLVDLALLGTDLQRSVRRHPASKASKRSQAMNCWRSIRSAGRRPA